MASVTQRIERMLGEVRAWRSGTNESGISLAPDLPDADERKLRAEIDLCIAGRGGEVAARRRAGRIGEAFLVLDEVGRKRFFAVLADDYGVDRHSVDSAISAVDHAGDHLLARRAAEAELREALTAPRARLLRRFIGLEDGLPFLVDLREELMALTRRDERYEGLDEDLRGLLESWFDVGLLRLEQITWDSSASLLEKLIEYEAVHAVESWDDLRNRLGPDRRLYAFTHAAVPGEPLIFVEVALTRGMSDNITDLLDPSIDDPDPDEADTAIFYSISNCRVGLAGVNLGDFLIKRVVERLSAELPHLETFATLSPIPGFRGWLERALSADDPLLTDEERAAIAPDDSVTASRRLLALLQAHDWHIDPVAVDTMRPILTRLCAEYLVRERRNGRAADRVANFHLSNGARIERLNYLANPAPAGQERAVGMMVNYRYLPSDIERNHDRYINEGVIAHSDRVRHLL
ncbi:MAG: malonyl-CoA decarboxylase [Actinomycetia bacterium]|nr:malonyl-CoA decarboxylase [Actinomycetes bacterium]MCP4085254.1 malonyl-CoA decarboxylase [Actinomycetes bacterium]